MKVSIKKLIGDFSPSAVRDMFKCENSRHMLVYNHKKWTIYSETVRGIKSTTHLNRVDAHNAWRNLKKFHAV